MKPFVGEIKCILVRHCKLTKRAENKKGEEGTKEGKKKEKGKYSREEVRACGRRKSECAEGERNYAAISVLTIRRKRNYGINGGVRRGVIKNDTWGRGSLFQREWQRKFCTAHLAYYSLLSTVAERYTRNKSLRYDSRCIAFVILRFRRVSFLREKSTEKTRKRERILKLISINASKYDSFVTCIYI